MAHHRTNVGTTAGRTWYIYHPQHTTSEIYHEEMLATQRKFHSDVSFELECDSKAGAPESVVEIISKLETVGQ